MAYFEQGISGFSGALSPDAISANENLTHMCNELIAAYKRGDTTYMGYTIDSKQAFIAMLMKMAFGN